MEIGTRSAILFLIFNRPGTTIQVFKRIREVKPARLYISADGPRSADEKAKCEEARSVVAMVDWPCQVFTRFSEVNQGCRYGVSSGISWFFENEPEGIIVEDDCLPDLSFFRYADELLEKYRNDEIIMHIGASNFQHSDFNIDQSYYFSRYNHIWGWATWRRAWKHYEVDMRQINTDDFKMRLAQLFEKSAERSFWLEMFKYVRSGNINTWDYQWMFALWMHQGLAITPAVNLVSNIGFGAGGTNTQIGDEKFAGNKTISMAFPLKHPDKIEINKAADHYTGNYLFKIFQNAKTFNLKIKLARVLPLKWKNGIKKWMS
jgi:hypothetical protein